MCYKSQFHGDIMASERSLKGDQVGQPLHGVYNDQGQPPGIGDGQTHSGQNRDGGAPNASAQGDQPIHGGQGDGGGGQYHGGQSQDQCVQGDQPIHGVHYDQDLLQGGAGDGDQCQDQGGGTGHAPDQGDQPIHGGLLPGDGGGGQSPGGQSQDQGGGASQASHCPQSLTPELPSRGGEETLPPTPDPSPNPSPEKEKPSLPKPLADLSSAAELPSDQMPTYSDILRHCLYVRDKLKKNMNPSDYAIAKQVASDVTTLWQTLVSQFTEPVIMTHKSITNKVKDLLTRYKAVVFVSSTTGIHRSKKESLLADCHKFFDILACKRYVEE